MLKERPALVSAVHALFPTISHMAQTPNGRSLSPLFSSWSLRPVFYSTSFLSYLPTGLTSRLVSLLTGQSGSGAKITTELVSSPETVIAALVMARQELAKVTALDVDLLDQYGDRLWIYWTEKDGDGWVTEEAIQEIEACLEKKWGEAGRKRRARCQEGMPHAFVLDEGQYCLLPRLYMCTTWLRCYSLRVHYSQCSWTDSFSVQATRPRSLANAPTGSSPTSPTLPPPPPPLPAVPSHPTCACDILVDVPCFLLTVILSLLCLFHRRVQMRVNAEDAARPILPSTV